jgi:hypothetical protein
MMNWKQTHLKKGKMTIFTGNSVVDGDDGSDCRSPYHNPDKCHRCQEEKEEAERIEQEAKEEAEEVARYEAEEKQIQEASVMVVRKKRKRIRKAPILEYKFMLEETQSEKTDNNGHQGANT